MILLNMPGLARPVRMVPKSSRATETAFSIFSSASKSVSSITLVSVFCRVRSLVALRTPVGRRGRRRSGVGADHRADLLTVDRAGDVALLGQVEDDDREVVVAAEADRRGVGDFEPPCEELVVGQGVEADCCRVGL